MKAIVSVLLFIGAGAAGWAQSGFSTSMGAVLDVTVDLVSKTEPPQPDVLRGPTGATFFGRGRPQGISRYIADKNTHEYTGYDMKLEAVKPGQYRVTFAPLTLSPSEMSLPDSADWRMGSPPSFPGPQIVTTADTIVVDLMENPTTGQKIVDYIRLQRRNCDSVGEGAAQVTCLTAIVEDMRHELQENLSQAEAKNGGAAQQAIVNAQQSWIRYKDDTCSNFDTEAKRLNCEIELTRDRIHDLHVY